MSNTSDDPDYWMERAKGARNAAKQLSDQKMKNILGKIAIGYERIAEYVRITSQSKDGDKP
jgi:hypothetical protein